MASNSGDKWQVPDEVLEAVKSRIAKDVVTCKWLCANTSLNARQAQAFLQAYVDERTADQTEEDALSCVHFLSGECKVAGGREGLLKRRLMFVLDRDLSAAKLKYETLTSCHIYAIFAGKLTDLCSVMNADQEIVVDDQYLSKLMIQCSMAKPVVAAEVRVPKAQAPRPVMSLETTKVKMDAETTSKANVKSAPATKGGASHKTRPKQSKIQSMFAKATPVVKKEPAPAKPKQSTAATAIKEDSPPLRRSPRKRGGESLICSDESDQSAHSTPQKTNTTTPIKHKNTRQKEKKAKSPTPPPPRPSNNHSLSDLFSADGSSPEQSPTKSPEKPIVAQKKNAKATKKAPQSRATRGKKRTSAAMQKDAEEEDVDMEETEANQSADEPEEESEEQTSAVLKAKNDLLCTQQVLPSQKSVSSDPPTMKHLQHSQETYLDEDGFLVTRRSSQVVVSPVDAAESSAATSKPAKAKPAPPVKKPDLQTKKTKTQPTLMSFFKK